MAKIKYDRPAINKISINFPDKFGVKPKLDIISEIDGVNVHELAKNYGSPLYVFSEKTIKETYEKAKLAFESRYPKVQFAWSYKTNHNDALCSLYHKLGSWAEVVSGFEYEKAINNGINPEKIIFNGPAKTKPELERAVKNGSMIHIDNFDELYYLIEIADNLQCKPKVAVRVNMDVGIFPIWDKFGFNYENGEAWNAINRIMLSEKLELVGLHTHLGTYITGAWAYANAAVKLADLAIGLEEKYKYNIQYIDLGGGFASQNTLKGSFIPGTDTCPTFDDYSVAISEALINSGIGTKELPMLILETGRALIDNAGYLLTTVLANKRISSGKRAMVIDAGINLLFTSLWYEHQILPTEPFSEFTEDTIVYGPLCMNIDVIRDNIKFPLMKKNDILVITKVGAYNLSQWWQFITQRPKVILIDFNKNAHIIRENENVESLAIFEKVPEFLKPNKT